MKDDIDALWRKLTKLKWGEHCIAYGDDRACGGNLECHHIKPRSRGLIARYHPENGIPLCHSHHWLWHKDILWAKKFILKHKTQKELDKLELDCSFSSPQFDYQLEKLFLEAEIKKFTNMEEELPDS